MDFVLNLLAPKLSNSLLTSLAFNYSAGSGGLKFSLTIATSPSYSIEDSYLLAMVFVIVKSQY